MVMMTGVEAEGATNRSVSTGLRVLKVGGRGVGSLEFAEAARQLGPVIRQHGCVVPSFRSPPRQKGQLRSIRRGLNGSVTIAIALRGRSLVAVVADMVDGVVAASRLDSQLASDLREDLWEAVSSLLATPVEARSAAGSSVAGHAPYARVHELRPLIHMSEAA